MSIDVSVTKLSGPIPVTGESTTPIWSSDQPLHPERRGVMRLDADLRIVDACVTARRLMGRREDDLIGWSLVDLVEDGAANLVDLCARLAGGEIGVGVVEVRPLARNTDLPRSQLTVGWLPQAAGDRGARPADGSYAVVIAPVDGSRDRADDELAGRAIADRSPDLVLRYRLWPERGFDLVSPSSHELLGYPPAAFYADPELLVHLAVDPDEVVRFVRRCEAGVPLPADPVLHLRHRDGRIRAFELRVTSVRDAERRLLAIEAVGRDVTDRDEADQELRAIVALRRAMHEVAGRDLDQADPSEVLQAALAAVCQHTGWEVGHAFLLGTEPGFLASAEVWHLDDPDRYEGLRSVTDSQQWPADADLAGDAIMLAEPTVVLLAEIDPNQRSRRARSSGLEMAVVVPVPIDDAVGAALEFLSRAAVPPNSGLMRALEETAIEVGRAMKRSTSVLRLHRMDEARAEFVNRAAHELRGPVGSVALMASALAHQARRSSATELAPSLERLSLQAERIQTMATRLLSLSQLESGRLDVELVAVELSPAVEAAVDAMLPEPGPAVGIEVDDDLEVLADPLLLDEILANLLANARRYGGPHIEVVARALPDVVEIAVCDDGPGISSEGQAHLFEPMRQKLASPDHAGLGLALVRQMAQTLGGEVSYERPAGGGSRFVVTLERC